MDFKTATDQLCETTSHVELASTLGVSVATIRQARLEPTAKAYRNPPPDWINGIKTIAACKLERIKKLLLELDKLAETELVSHSARFDSTTPEDDGRKTASERTKPGQRPFQLG